MYDETIKLGALSIPSQAVETAIKLSSAFLTETGSDGLLGLAFPEYAFHLIMCIRLLIVTSSGLTPSRPPVKQHPSRISLPRTSFPPQYSLSSWTRATAMAFILSATSHHQQNRAQREISPTPRLIQAMDSGSLAARRSKLVTRFLRDRTATRLSLILELRYVSWIILIVFHPA